MSPASTSDRPADRFAVNAPWLIKLRWVAVVGQLITIAVVVFVFRIEIRLAPLMVVLAITAISNLGLTLWFYHKDRKSATARQLQQWYLVLALIVTLDLLSLTTLLHFTGGPNNPFNFFFFVNLSLCAVVLPRGWAWTLNLVAVICFAWLMYHHIPVQELDLGPALQPIRVTNTVYVEQQGMLVAFATCCSVIVYFMTRLTAELRQQELDLRRAEAIQARSEKLQALGTLAAGAAHELATPLSTIAVVAKEVENQLQHPENQAALVEDIGLIRGELDRCREILDQMAGDAGQTTGEPIVRVSAGNLLDKIRSGLPAEANVQFLLSPSSSQCELAIPLNGLAQVIRGIIKNGLDASGVDQVVQVCMQRDADRFRIEVQDQGAGMSREVLNRVSEPFFTTKEPGKGMGLGVFLARNMIEQLEGRMEIQSQIDQGTTVTMTFPQAPQES